LFALDIPLFSIVQAHRNILIGLGGYRQRAWLSAGRWLARLALIMLFVGLGFAINGAIVALIGASVVELVVARRFVRPSFWGRSNFPIRLLLAAATPLFILGICLRLFDRIDLFILKSLGASAAQAGLYGAAGNLAVMPGLFAQSFSPLLLSTLTRLRRDGQEAHARSMARDSLRLVILLLPGAALIAGAAPEIVRLVTGPQFNGAAPLLQALIFAAIGSVLISVATGVLIAANRSWWTMAVGVPTVLVAVGALFWAIPQWGARGAANVTAGCAWLGAVIAVALVAAHWKIAPPVWSVIRSVAVSGAAFALASWWSTPGAWVVVKLAVLGIGVVAAYLGLGEFNARERALAWSLMPGRKAAAGNE
jgi:O-antigen/teichoic acid export membrane protein